ncbi:hypothetical protein ACROYT_G042456 [Oculina patagonica]
MKGLLVETVYIREWPNPVLLKNITVPSDSKMGLTFRVWDPRTNPADRYHLMPIITPAYPQKNSTFNVSMSTRTIMNEEFENGLRITSDVLIGKSTWDVLFQPSNFFRKYKHYIVLSALSTCEEDHLEWIGLVESKIRILISNLENTQYVLLAHVKPKSFGALEPDKESPTTRWFIGLQFDKKENVRIDMTGAIQMFTNTVHSQAVAAKMFKKGMRIEAKHVKKKQLSEYLPPSVLKQKEKSSIVPPAPAAAVKPAQADLSLDSSLNASDLSLEITSEPSNESADWIGSSTENSEEIPSLTSSDDKKGNMDAASMTSTVSTVGEVTSSDTTAIPSQPSAVSQDKPAGLKRAGSPSETENASKRARVDNTEITDKQLFWELMKMEIREKSILFTKQKSRVLSQREKEISKRLDYLDNIICNGNKLLNMSDTLNEYEVLKTELHSIYDRKGKAGMFRSKCRWIEKGEKPTKYFFNLEKRNYNRKTINEIRTEDDVEIREEKEILKAIQAFYEDLYSSKTISSQEEFDLFTENLNFPKLSDEDRDKIEGPLTLEECKTVRESFQENKSPGEDGFTVEFYKYFFELIGGHFLDSLNAAFEVGELTISQRPGVITLIPKDDSDLVELQNWRPITLLNTDYKIASKALARRIETILSKLIHPDQTGFMKGRYIGENLRLISDVMEYTKTEELTGVLVSVDFKKAFDTLEWPFIKSVLSLFNFGESVKRWTSVFYTNVKNAVLNNGFATNWFKPTRGVVGSTTKGSLMTENCTKTADGKIENLTDKNKTEESKVSVSTAVERSISPTNEDNNAGKKMKQDQVNATNLDPEKELIDEGPPPASQIPVVKNAIKIELK